MALVQWWNGVRLLFSWLVQNSYGLSIDDLPHTQATLYYITGVLETSNTGCLYRSKEELQILCLTVEDSLQAKYRIHDFGRHVVVTYNPRAATDAC